MTKNNHQGFNPHQPTLLRNKTCAYCGAFLEENTRSKEHVIGRRFVPKGSLSKSWNLILQSCTSCNNLKSELEDDISAISMQPDAWGNREIDDEQLMLEGERKGRRAISRETGKPVDGSENNFEISYQFSKGVNFKFSLTAPPSIACHRVYELCRLQMMAFYYLITYDKSEDRGFYWIGDFMPMMEATRSDWGNNIHTSFMSQVANWELRFLVIAANGFFKASIRKQPNFHCWSWALEWNQKFRIVGFIGDKEQARKNISTFKGIEKKTLNTDDASSFGMWTETPLDDKEDTMFQP
jgi:hypothetical protein